MANPEHLAILKKGVAAWNEWRERQPDAKPDFANANLYGVNFCGADLSYANLIKATLLGAHFGNANLYEADLWNAGIRLADFQNANLHKAHLIQANLGDANLSRANLRGAQLCEVNLSRAVLAEANLSWADLKYSQLTGANLTASNLTGARLYGASRDDWAIKNVTCDYVFWDRRGLSRCPPDRDFARGEFEQLYRTLPTIEYVFENGMSPLDSIIMDRVVEAIRKQNPEYDIKIDSISARGLAPSIKFTVLLEEYKEAALAQVHDLYEVKLRQVETERDRYWAAITRVLDRPREVKLIAAAPGSIVATDGSTVNIEQHIHHAIQLQKAIAEQQEDSPTFAKVAKKTALDIIGGALKDVAKGQVKEAAKQIYGLGKDLGPVIASTAAYAFFRSYLGQ